MYPAALVYPLTLTAEDLQSDSFASPKINKLTGILQQMPGYELTRAFVEAVECLLHPNLKFCDCQKEILIISKNKKLTSSKRKEKALEALKSLIDDLFNTNKTYVKGGIGRENDRFIKKYRKKFLGTVGKNGEKAKKMDLKRIVKAFVLRLERLTLSLFLCPPILPCNVHARALATVLVTKGQTNKQKKETILHSPIVRSKDFDTFKTKQGKMELRDYSEWLADFDASKYVEVLEVPGQYSGLRRPEPSSHLTIVSFDPSIRTMGSIRKPKKVTIRTNDEREENWLVKGGEDLRMDQRIEQLFDVTNQILTSSSACVSRNLVIRTFDVIPMTRSMGIIEWVPNTMPIKGMLKEQMKKQKIKATFTDFIRGDYLPQFCCFCFSLRVS